MTPAEQARFEALPTNTVEDTARYLRIGINQAYTAVKRGELPGLKLGRRILVPTRNLLALLSGDEHTDLNEASGQDPHEHTSLLPR
jgi:excisionase family DNA binding protein